MDESYNVAVLNSLKTGRPQAEGQFTLKDSACALRPTAENSYKDLVSVDISNSGRGGGLVEASDGLIFNPG